MPTSSPPAATSAPPPRKTTANPSSRKWPASPLNGVGNKPKRAGWRLIRTRGSHRQFKHPVKPGRVTVPGKPGDDLPPGAWISILKQSGLRE